MYLFHNGTTWIFGPTVDSECPAGQYRIEPSADHESVSIHQVARGATFLFNKPIANFKKANGESYANFAEFKAAYTGFFSTPIGEGTGGDTTGGLTDAQLRAAAVPVSQATQPLPTGAATSAKQDDGSQKTQTVDPAGINTESRFRVLKQTITRPANTTPVIANGVLTALNGLISKFANANKAAGYGLMITDFRIQTNDTGVAGKTFRLHVYDDAVAPTTYNNAFALDDANAGKRRGKIEAVFATSGNLTRVASNLADAIIINPVGTDLYFKLECVEGFTPSSNSTWFEVQLGVVQTN